jgi:hypothetical protein
VAALAGCATIGAPPAGPPPPRTVATYFPLVPTSAWSYRVENLVQGRTYRAEVTVRSRAFVEAIGIEGIQVEEEFVGNTGPGLVEEPEPILYFHKGGYLERVYLTYQGGKAVPVGLGSEESRFLPEALDEGRSWDSTTAAFRLGGGWTYDVVHHHRVALEPATVDVPAGSFRNCIRVDTHSSHGPGSGGGTQELVFYYSDWYAPGVGLVRTRQWGDAERRQERTRIDLLDYRIGGEGG